MGRRLFPGNRGDRRLLFFIEMLVLGGDGIPLREEKGIC